ncbi:MAG TPA: helix-turn-helix transcriptional regulator [Planctomycetaceae bacterium]|nr:helix-turn-helix transcriptional regulator [Planctomycetaceae bacterium]
MSNNAQDLQIVTLLGRRFVIVPEAEYRRLQQAQSLPPLPEADADGTRPARESMRVMLAREIIVDRRRLGLTQAELARRAGIRPETLNRIEQRRHSPSIATVEKIDRALKEIEAEQQASLSARRGSNPAGGSSRRKRRGAVAAKPRGQRRKR